ncbi:MAG: hypothetical protein PQJ60_15290, partial [Spirochaetales bacterium]|nr:hypothetical protein [Spirochaetales bacterium]
MTYLNRISPLLTTYLIGQHKPSEFLALYSLYYRQLLLVGYTGIPWNFILYLGSIYLMLCSFGKRLPLLLSYLLGSLFFFLFKLPIAIFMIIDRGRSFGDLRGLVQPTLTMGISVTVLGTIGLALLIFSLIKSPPAVPGKTSSKRELDRAGFLISTFTIFLPGIIIAGSLILFPMKIIPLAQNKISLITTALAVVIKIITIVLMVRRMRHAGLNPCLLFLMIPYGLLPGTAFFLMLKGTTVELVTAGQNFLTLSFSLSSLVFLTLALWPEKRGIGSASLD